MKTVTAKGQPIAARLPCTVEEFLAAQGLLPRSTGARAPARFNVQEHKLAW